MTLGAVHENGDGGQDVADRQLAAGEDGPRRDGELAVAGLALEDAASAELPAHVAAALRANRISLRLGPADRLEGLIGLVLGHPHDLRQRKGAGGRGEEEVLTLGARHHHIRCVVHWI